LIWKIFIFQFVNTYTSLYYIAFLKANTDFWGSGLHDGCKIKWSTADNQTFGAGCLNELTIQLVSLLLTNMIIGQLKEVLIPYIISRIGLRQKKDPEALEKEKEEQEKEDKRPEYEKQSKLQNFGGTMDEFTEMVIQYGQVTLFAASFPAAPLLAFLNNIIEIRTDGFKMLTSMSRPMFKGARDIGTWYQILEILGYIAVLTNCMLIAFDFSSIHILFNGNGLYALIFGIVLEHAIILLKFLIAIAVPDMPGDVKKELSRQNFIRDASIRAREDHLISTDWKDKWVDTEKEESSEDEGVDEDKKKRREKRKSQRKSKKDKKNKEETVPLQVEESV